VDQNSSSASFESAAMVELAGWWPSGSAMIGVGMKMMDDSCKRGLCWMGDPGT